ncbi:glycosyltransferase family 2 protein [Alicyclobacillus fastidiosus]|uniref:Glycosyltransferase family A protein n=1 Tax=Alicyclobacillus fastidiosus TaxID=392011 RepID=A0ABV5AG67_9BACL|nr:glycosyltransferase family A protein [Alicyclobacillus fastidiosus]WEH08898.1 glycosyltransferase family A protein [Alicyclobacillus fastidiosus]
MGFPRKSGLVSIVVPAFNSAMYLSDCLDSLQSQTYPDVEVIVVNDASTDATKHVLDVWVKRRNPQDRSKVLTVTLPRNVGFAGAIHTGFFLSEGEFIAVQDSDDLSHPERISRQVAYLRAHPEIDLVGTNYKTFRKHASEPGRTPTWLAYGDQIKSVYANGGHCVCHGTILFRGRLFDTVGGPTRRIEGAEDYEFITKCLSLQANIENIPDVLYYYREHEHQRSRTFYH